MATVQSPNHDWLEVPPYFIIIGFIHYWSCLLWPSYIPLILSISHYHPTERSQKFSMLITVSEVFPSHRIKIPETLKRTFSIRFARSKLMSEPEGKKKSSSQNSFHQLGSSPCSPSWRVASQSEAARLSRARHGPYRVGCFNRQSS